MCESRRAVPEGLRRRTSKAVGLFGYLKGLVRSQSIIRLAQDQKTERIDLWFRCLLALSGGRSASLGGGESR